VVWESWRSIVPLRNKTTVPFALVLATGKSSRPATSETRASTAADCYEKAVGSMRGDVLVVRFVPFTMDVFAYSAAQAESENRSISIRFTAGDAEILCADTEGGSERRSSDPINAHPSIDPGRLPRRPDSVSSACFTQTLISVRLATHGKAP